MSLMIIFMFISSGCSSFLCSSFRNSFVYLSMLSSFIGNVPFCMFSLTLVYVYNPNSLSGFVVNGVLSAWLKCFT